MKTTALVFSRLARTKLVNMPTCRLSGLCLTDGQRLTKGHRVKKSGGTGADKTAPDGKRRGSVCAVFGASSELSASLSFSLVEQAIP